MWHALADYSVKFALDDNNEENDAVLSFLEHSKDTLTTITHDASIVSSSQWASAFDDKYISLIALGVYGDKCAGTLEQQRPLPKRCSPNGNVVKPDETRRQPYRYCVECGTRNMTWCTTCMWGPCCSPNQSCPTCTAAPPAPPPPPPLVVGGMVGLRPLS